MTSCFWGGGPGILEQEYEGVWGSLCDCESLEEYHHTTFWKREWYFYTVTVCVLFLIQQSHHLLLISNPLTTCNGLSIFLLECNFINT